MELGPVWSGLAVVEFFFFSSRDLVMDSRDLKRVTSLPMKSVYRLGNLDFLE